MYRPEPYLNRYFKKDILQLKRRMACLTSVRAGLALAKPKGLGVLLQLKARLWAYLRRAETVGV